MGTVVSRKHLKILMAENAEWETIFKVGSHHYARSFIEDGHDVLWLSSSLHLLNYLKDREGAKRRFKLWRTEPEGEAGKSPKRYCPLTLLPYRRYPLLDSTNVGIRSLYCTVPPLPRWLKRKGWSKVDVLWVTNVDFYALTEMVKHKLLVYRVYDEIAGFPNVPRSALELEEELIRKADLVFCTSYALTDKVKRIRSDVHYLPNGTNYSKFSAPAVDIPSDYQSIPHPRILFAGLISHWFDVEMMVSAAKELKDYSFVFIGPSTIDISALQALPNVYILGPRDHSMMPAYYQHSDVGIIPFVVNDLTNGASPVKLFEYLASGIPVVSTDLDEIRRLNSPALLAKDTGSFIAQIKAAIGSKGSASYSDFGRNNDWQRRFEAVNSLINSKLG